MAGGKETKIEKKILVLASFLRILFRQLICFSISKFMSLKIRFKTKSHSVIRPKQGGPRPFRKKSPNLLYGPHKSDFSDFPRPQVQTNYWVIIYNFSFERETPHRQHKQ